MLEGLKPFFNMVLRPLVRPAVRIGVRPDHLTIAGLALSGVAGWFAYTGSWTTACIISIVGSLFDGLDGAVARESNRKSTFGAILDSCCDRIAEVLIIMGVLVFFLTSQAVSLDKEYFSLALRSWGILFCYTAVTMSLMVSYVKARCEGAGVPCSRGLLQRPERVILLCAGLLAGPPVMVPVLAAVSLLAAVTVVQRICEAYRKSKGPAIS
jgi:CDP-diacylglycerol--glycerol-3-phosphate 3-phosphatidyltransferase